MGEYGRVVGQSSGGSGRSGGSSDLTGQVMAAVTDAFEQIAALPPEMLIGAAVAIMIGGMLIFRR